MSLGTPAGSRVMVVMSIKDNVAKVLGEGVYVGDEVPDKALFPHLAVFSDAKIPNPRINLDSGDVVWGCECWWGDVEGAKRRLSTCTVIPVRIADYRPKVTSEAAGSSSAYDDDEIQSL